jgi:hypothetical protein
MKKYFSLLLILILVSSFCQNEDGKQLFKTKIKANVTINDTINLDEFKGVALIPGGHLRKDLEKINYFTQIMTEKEFKKELKNAGLDPAKFNFDSQQGVENVFKHYKKFIYVYQSIRNEDPNMQLIVISNPMGKRVFEVEGRDKTRVLGISAGTKYLPEDLNNAMFNELVDYIRRNSKTYK